MRYNVVKEALEKQILIKEGTNTYETVHNKHDKGYKYLLSAKKIFLQLIQTFIKEKWVDQIKEQNILHIDKSFGPPALASKNTN